MYNKVYINCGTLIFFVIMLMMNVQEPMLCSSSQDYESFLINIKVKLIGVDWEKYVFNIFLVLGSSELISGFSTLKI